MKSVVVYSSSPKHFQGLCNIAEFNIVIICITVHITHVCICASIYTVIKVLTNKLYKYRLLGFHFVVPRYTISLLPSSKQSTCNTREVSAC